MHLNLGRVGSYLSDRLVLDPQGTHLEAVTGPIHWLERTVAWIHPSSSYCEENRRAVGWLETTLLEKISRQRYLRLCGRYGLNVTKMKEQGSPLLSRDVAKIAVGLRDVNVQDVEEWIREAKQDPQSPPRGVSEPLWKRLSEVKTSADLSASEFSAVYRALSIELDGQLKVPPIQERITGRPGEWWARVVFDPFVADRERLEISAENRTETFSVFAHAVAARVVKREMEVGALISAPDAPDGTERYYRVAAKLITAEGMVSYVFVPVTEDANLPSLRVYRGTSPRTGEIDGLSSVITDLEPDLGATAYASGAPYQEILKQKTPYSIVIGHSLGSTLAQKELAENTNLVSAYLFSGPGAAEGDIRRLNQRLERHPVSLTIRDSEDDFVNHIGQVHAGYEWPLDLDQLDYQRYYGPKEAYRTHPPHVTVWGQEEELLYGIEGGLPRKDLNERFYRKYKVLEIVRVYFGWIAAALLRLFRDALRFLCGARELELRGLHLGTYQNDSYNLSRYNLDEIPPLHS